MIKAILFDYGGTIDTGARHWFHVLYEGYVNAGMDFTAEDFRPAYVYAERALARSRYIVPTDDFFLLLYKKVLLEMEYLIHHGIWSPENVGRRYEVASAVAGYCDEYARRHASAAIPVLGRLAGKYRLVVVSNFYGNLSAILSTYRLSSCFGSVIESAVVGVRKPNPEIFRLGVEAAGAGSPEECVVVGDSFTKDIVPARSLGCETVWFKGEEWESVERDETFPAHVISSLNELERFY